ncbi:dTDP-4-dehydrorhamnose reductase [Brevundimonas sp.]|uniref:dTDP-4-dehydrorhamnose reductase n=1 Tax=Brevundimonas sp. TaxID=1871086 RepID=UPI002ED8B8C6
MTSGERRVLIAGGRGRLARALTAAAWPRGWAPVAVGRAELDVTNAEAVTAWVGRHKPALIVNAAAFTGVDLAESERAAAFAVNAAGAGHLAEAAVETGADLIHVSTDFVFDGQLGRPYVETDATAPLNVYGASKLEGEQRVLEAHPRALVLRTAWLLGGRGGSFIEAILKRAARGEALRVVADQVGNPTDVNDLARAVVAAAERLAQGPTPQRLYHVAGADAATWHQIARAAVEAWARLSGVTAPPVTAIASNDWPSPARRPQDSRLDSAAFARDFGMVLPGWRERIADWAAESAGAKR